MNGKWHIVSLLSIFIFSSCTSDDEFRVDAAFVEYVHRFESEAAHRGRNFDFEMDGLIIEFADLEEGTGGLCHAQERPIRIEIDRNYWNAISQKEGADWMKENLIFHEMGHGPLGREHLNTILPNGDWKSMLCGGDDKIDGRFWNINYRSARRMYYLDELFDESTAEPAFAQLNSPVDTSFYTSSLFSSSLFSLSFENASNAGWAIEDNVTYATSIDNGRLQFQNKTNHALYVPFDLASRGFDVQNDFSFSLSFEYPMLSGNEKFGLIFGRISGTEYLSLTESIDYVSISNDRKLYLGNSLWYSFFAEIPIVSSFQEGKNVIRVYKQAEILYVYLNGRYVYQSEIGVQGAGSHIGFLVPSNSSLWVDDLIVTQNILSPIASPSKMKGKKEVVCKVIEVSTNHFIYRQ